MSTWGNSVFVFRLRRVCLFSVRRVFVLNTARGLFAFCVSCARHRAFSSVSVSSSFSTGILCTRCYTLTSPFRMWAFLALTTLSHCVTPSHCALSDTTPAKRETVYPTKGCAAPPIGYGFLTGNNLTSTDRTYAYALTLRLPPDHAPSDVLHDSPSSSLSSSDFSGATLYAALPFLALFAVSLVYVILVVLSDVIFVLLPAAHGLLCVIFAALSGVIFASLSSARSASCTIFVVTSDVIFAPHTAILCVLSRTMIIVLFLLVPIVAHATRRTRRIYTGLFQPKSDPNDFAAALAAHVRTVEKHDECDDSHFALWLRSPLNRMITLLYRVYASASASFARYSGTDYRLYFAQRASNFIGRLPLRSLVFILATYCAYAAEDNGNGYTSRPPPFDGTRLGFLPWLMAFSGWVAWKLTDAADILDGTSPRPMQPPLPDPNAPAAVQAADQAAHDTWEAEHSAWVAENRKLYGAIIQSMPDWLRTSIYNDHRNDGFTAIEYLRASFDARDANDHAAEMARLQSRYIDPRNEISEDDLRMQYDAMMVAKAGITRTGNAPPPDSALIAMFDNSLPISYAQIRQLVRRSGHASFLDHYNDYMGQVRAELTARAPQIQAFAAASSTGQFLPRPPPQSHTNGNGPEHSRGTDNGDRNGGNGITNLCLRCCKPGHTRPNCTKPKKSCKYCTGDHASRLCPKGPGGKHRDQLSAGARRLLEKDVREAASDSDSSSDTPGSSAQSKTPSASTTNIVDAAPHADAAVAATAPHSDPGASGQAYNAALRALGF